VIDRLYLIDYDRGMEKITVYTDGGCSGNPGPGGWAFALETQPVVTGSGCDRMTTNNKMELTAVIKALEYMQEHHPETPVELHTDSQYVKQGITVWIHSWLRNGWKTSAKKPVKNKELWVELKELSDTLSIDWRWVKGHAGIELNELCDSLVGQQIECARGRWK
jgi:ribonuclease HI